MMQTTVFRHALGAIVALGLAGAHATAQEATAEPPVAGLPLGETVQDENAPGTVYLREANGDWEVRCQRAPEGGIDPCNMYQLLRDPGGQAVAEISMFAMPPGQDAAAGAQIITPMETLLTQQVTVSVDGGPAKRYPFAFCTTEGTAGCVAQAGFTADDIAAFKRGNAASVTIVPARAQNNSVDLTMSLTGFTASYTILEEVIAEAMSAMGEASDQ